MATFTINTFSVTQTPAQAALKLVSINYNYTLNCDEDDCAINESVTVTIDIFNTDEGNTAIATGVDSHVAKCDEGYTIINPKTQQEEEVDCGYKTDREVIVGESLVDTTMGADPIKITMKGNPTSSGIGFSETSPTVNTNF